VDSLSRENEGDLIIAAQDMTPEKMAFMIRHTSGLICAPLLPARCTSLQLPQMVASAANADPNRTAYTVSVDANHPATTTGISAHDRALTCRLLADPDAVPADFRRPGHLFPLRAREAGVLERKGHTEAAVDFCRLAGKREVAVISEIVDDGEEVAGIAERRGAGMLRRGGCLEFGKRWGLRVCTIEDLAAYVEKVAGANGHVNGTVNGKKGSS
jgi:3,4-dihydroxy 2-butanone 4-phosphate synthase